MPVKFKFRVSKCHKITLENSVLCNCDYKILNVVSSEFQIHRYCYPGDCVLLINFPDAARLRNLFFEPPPPMQSNSIIYGISLISIALRESVPSTRARIDESLLALGDEFYLRSDSLIFSLIGAGTGLTPSGARRWCASAKGVREACKENMKCFIYLGRVRVSPYRLAYNVEPNAVKLTQNYVQNSCEARARNSAARTAAPCCPADIVTHVNTLNKLKCFSETAAGHNKLITSLGERAPTNIIKQSRLRFPLA